MQGLQYILDGTQCMTVDKSAKAEAGALAKLAISLSKGEKSTDATGTTRDDTGKRDVPSVLLDLVSITTQLHAAGHPLRRAARGGAAGRVDVRDLAHPLRPSHLRDRGQHRGGSTRRHRRHAAAHLGVRHQFRHGGTVGHRGGLGLNSVTPDAGAGNTLLYAVGAAVIGGTSLFGGKGKMHDAIIGGLVIATIANGLGLLGKQADVNYAVTGAVLLLAASVDAISRRRRSAAGR